MFVLKNFSRSLVQIYLQSIEYKLDLAKNQLDLIRVIFPARNLKERKIYHSTNGPAAKRNGYGIAEMTLFYHMLKNESLLIRDLKDFNLLILPIFYLIHGEAYDSQDPETMTSYHAVITPK